MNDSPIHALAERNLKEHQETIYARTDRMFGWVMLIQYALAVVFALVLTPRTYDGSVSRVHPHVWTALFLGGALAAYPIYLSKARPGETATRHTIAIAQALFSALLIHLTGGRIETHFHVFGSLAFLAMYRDWRVLVTASAIVATDHFVRGLWFPETIYGGAVGASWRFLEHAGWVVFEDVFLMVGLATSQGEMRLQAQRQAELELAQGEMARTAEENARQTGVLNSILTGMNDAVVVVDHAGGLLCCNPAARAIVGRDVAEAPFERWPEAMSLRHEPDEEPWPADAWPLARAMRGEKVDPIESLMCARGTEESVWLEISAQPLQNEGDGCVGGIAVFRDVTERRRMQDESTRAREEAERANEAKSEFLSRMSHELRTPMNAILGFGQLLRLDELSEDQEESVDQILRSGAHLLRLINEVLDISGIEAGKLTLSREPVDATAVVAESFGMVQPLAHVNSVTLRLHPTPSEEAFVMADHQRLLQVAINLVSNAIKYNRRGGEVRVRLESNDDRRRLLVEDDGIGIPLEKQDRLFCAFERLGAQESSVEGTGLGLALSRRLVQAMGGEIGLLPRERGTCFFVDLPSVECPLQSFDASNFHEDGAASSVTEADLLLVEDNPANIELMRRVLRTRTGVHLRVARRGEDALAMVRDVLPDLVLLDMDLPDVNGLSVIQNLRAADGSALLPIVVVSADANPAHIRRALDAGATEYMTKPYDVKALLALIDDAVSRPGVRRVA